MQLTIFIFALLTSSVLISLVTSDDAEKGREAMGSFTCNATDKDFPAAINEDAFFRTVKHALETTNVPTYPGEFSFDRYQFDLNRPLKGRNSLKLPVFKTERPEVVAIVANLVGLKANKFFEFVGHREHKVEHKVEDDHFKAVEIGKKLFRMMQYHLVLKYDRINGDSEMKPSDKKKKMKDIEEKFWKVQTEINKLNVT